MQLLKRLFGHKKPERKVKPHIKLHIGFTNCYECVLTGSDGHVGYYLEGFGRTPREAYEDWYRRYNGEF